jgi:hypothetical protein
MALKRSLPALVALVLALALCAAAMLPASGSARARPRAHAHAARTYMTGIGDEQTQMFGSPLWKQLHMRIARYITPYDTVAHHDTLARATAWIRAAEEQHVKVLVAFYYSKNHPTTLPSVASYKHLVQKFVRRFPYVRQYQSWNEANRKSVPHRFSSPSAGAAAAYYQALLRVCTRCTVIGLDVLDEAKTGRTLRYIAEFKTAVNRLHTIMPRIWGLHNYSDVNRYESWRTKEVSRALGGQIWLTETGGIVQFGGLFPNRNGSGLVRAAKVIHFTFGLAASQPQITRLYLYDWTGGLTKERFDAGLTDRHNRPRAGYVVVCKHFNAPRCNVHVARH